jgi:hypothetical protein
LGIAAALVVAAAWGMSSRRESSSGGQPNQSEVQSSLDKHVYTHVTRESNVRAIMTSGLDPAHGGKGGASAAVGRDDFIKRSTGFVHLGLDAEGIDNKPSEFYSGVYAAKRISSSVLRLSLPAAAHIHSDPDDPQGGRYKTTTAIPPSHIVPLPMKVAFRAPGVIGADYAPHDFVAGATRDIGGRTITQRTEDIRRAVHGTEKTIYPGS